MLTLQGTLPVINAEAVNLAIRAGIALNADIARRSKFDRKQYFYADLPKGYQISQYDIPVCSSGFLEVDTGEGTKRWGQGWQLGHIDYAWHNVPAVLC